MIQQFQIEKFIYLNKWFLNIVGLYPQKSWRFVTSLFCMLLLVIPQFVQIYLFCTDLSVILETSSVLFTILLAMLKGAVWIFNGKSMEDLVGFLFNEYWKIIESFDNSKTLVKYAGYYICVYYSYAIYIFCFSWIFHWKDISGFRYANKMTKGYTFLIINALLFFFSLPPIEILILKFNGTYKSSDKHFPFPATYPDFLKEFPYFQIVYFSQIIATMTCALVILATDTLIATALFHTCGQFVVIQQKLELLSSNDGHETGEMIKRKIILIVKHHQMVIGFSKKMERVFSPMMFLQVFASSMIICLVGLQVSTTFTNQYKLVKYFSYLLMALFQLLLFCWPGDQLLLQSGKVCQSAYFTKWYQFGKERRGEIQLMLLRSQKLIGITAGKFYLMSLENFNVILSTSMSYFMVLRSFNSSEGK
ncbi:odorant receptor 13a isoform X1 [Cephus cinctus]|uniref:Odorant receptor n=1 Tax=Cephus cinctus TaxID=211228 RepID=A0AAJ7C621_CEPCN|nr:odorant receptor 13a isoform X1 [Cephus cinctus]